ncbi:hypothetical protein L9F63_027085, partial [Diploptera punctata]
MVEHVLKYVHADGNFDSIFLHVQVNNEGAIDFYKKFGFEIVETKEHYYKRIEPADAHVLQKLSGRGRVVVKLIKMIFNLKFKSVSAISKLGLLDFN